MIDRHSHTLRSRPPLWACPVCGGPLASRADTLHCRLCDQAYERSAGIWNLLPADREAFYAAFLEQYEIVRRGENWGRDESAYYRALPVVGRDDPNRSIWQIRRRTYRTFLRRVLVPLESRSSGPVRAIDLGSGSGWLAYRLALRGHTVTAVDLRADVRDGLGAHVHYDATFTSVRADFVRLPFADSQFDLCIFNASLHYAEDCEATIREALRVLRPLRRLVILDSPVYRQDEDGRRMVRERETAFLARYGFAASRMKSEHFLTMHRLRELGQATHLTWRVFRPRPGFKTLLRSAASILPGSRRPARFPVIVAEKAAGSSTPVAHPSPTLAGDAP